MDAKDIEILQLQSGKPYLLGVGSFGSVCDCPLADHQPEMHVSSMTRACHCLPGCPEQYLFARLAGVV